MQHILSFCQNLIYLHTYYYYFAHSITIFWFTWIWINSIFQVVSPLGCSGQIIQSQATLVQFCPFFHETHSVFQVFTCFAFWGFSLSLFSTSLTLPSPTSVHSSRVILCWWLELFDHYSPPGCQHRNFQWLPIIYWTSIFLIWHSHFLGYNISCHVIHSFFFLSFSSFFTSDEVLGICDVQNKLHTCLSRACS